MEWVYSSILQAYTMRRRTFVALLAVAALAGCGDEEDPEEVPEEEEPEEDEPEPEPDDEDDDLP